MRRPIATPGDLASMYEADDVARAQTRLKSRVGEIYERAFLPNLLPDEQRALANMTLQTPLDGGPVLGYQSHSGMKTITMPAASLLFFEDLCTAYAWLYVNGYRLETVEEYLTMLKYKPVEAFGRRYPPPLKALGIPRDALNESRVNDLSLRFRNSGYAFILAHELGHIRFHHRRYQDTSVQQSQAIEREADRFALELMRRTGTIPMGAMLFFQVGIYHFDNRADFRSDAEWEAYLARSATHPLTADRLRELSKQFDALASDYARRGIASTDIVHFIGQQFAAFATFLGDPDLQRGMRARAERAGPSSLLPRRQREPS